MHVRWHIYTEEVKQKWKSFDVEIKRQHDCVVKCDREKFSRSSWLLFFPGCLASYRSSKRERCPDWNEEQQAWCRQDQRRTLTASSGKGNAQLNCHGNIILDCMSESMYALFYYVTLGTVGPNQLLQQWKEVLITFHRIFIERTLLNFLSLATWGSHYRRSETGFEKVQWEESCGRFPNPAVSQIQFGNLHSTL